MENFQTSYTYETFSVCLHSTLVILNIKQSKPTLKLVWGEDVLFHFKFGRWIKLSETVDSISNWNRNGEEERKMKNSMLVISSLCFNITPTISQIIYSVSSVDLVPWQLNNVCIIIYNKSIFAIFKCKDALCIETFSTQPFEQSCYTNLGNEEFISYLFISHNYYYCQMNTFSTS